MLKRNLIILCFIFLYLCFYKVNAKIFEKDLPLLGKVIYLDPGHGGRDPGSMYGTIKEAPINLKITEKLKTDLEELGAIVYMTREGDYDLSNPETYNRKNDDLQNRVNLIDQEFVDIYLSIHLNADTSNTWHGAQVFYDNVNKNNEKFAKIMQESFKINLNSKRKYKKISTYYMYRRIKKVPGLLLEVGFLTNANERYLMQTDSYQNKICDAITDGVINYFT